MRNNTINQINNNLIKKKISSVGKYSTKINTRIYKTLTKLNLINNVSKKTMISKNIKTSSIKVCFSLYKNNNKLSKLNNDIFNTNR